MAFLSQLLLKVFSTQVEVQNCHRPGLYQCARNLATLKGYLLPVEKGMTIMGLDEVNPLPTLLTGME